MTRHEGMNAPPRARSHLRSLRSLSCLAAAAVAAAAPARVEWASASAAEVLVRSCWTWERGWGREAQR